MTTIEDARAISRDWAKAATPDERGFHNAGGFALDNNGRIREAFDALIAEHERALNWDDKFDEIERLTTPPTDDDHEVLAKLVNDNHQCTRPWAELRQNEPAWTRSNGDDFAIREGFQAADALLAAGFRRQGPITDEWEHKTENRIHYRYGVNSGIYSGYPFGQTASHDEQQRRLESETSGPVDVINRESRTVLYGPWEPVEATEATS